jgi:DNA-binding response OmpR family regulator
MRVLIVDDDSALAFIVAEGLREEGISADVACDGDIGKLLVTAQEYDVIIIDRDAPAFAGAEAGRLLTGSHPGILLIAAAGTALAPLGVDSYLAKPFTYPELVARVRALGAEGGRRVTY